MQLMDVDAFNVLIVIALCQLKYIDGTHGIRCCQLCDGVLWPITSSYQCITC